MLKTRFNPEGRPESGDSDYAGPLLWRDSFETVHACRRIDIKEVFLLVTTLCGRNVPPNARWNTSHKAAITCPDCSRQKN